MKYDAYATNVVKYDFHNHVVIESMAIALREFEQEQLQSLTRQFVSLHHDHDDLVRWGLSLDSEHQRHFFDADELLQINHLRRTAMTSSDVRQMLGCTYHELNQWDADGSLSHAFTETISTPRKDDEIRLWMRQDVMRFKARVEDKRSSDELKKLFSSSRQPLRLVVSA
jgi:hypothetical protein